MRWCALWIVLWVGAAIVTSTAARAEGQPGPWTEFGSDGSLSVRIAAASGAACPEATADGAALPMQIRAPADGSFPFAVCEARAPAGTAKLTVAGAAVPTASAAVRRIVVIGDTGCRLEGRQIQDCNDPQAWPFAAIAARAAAHKPDLVIHVGDYYYRETACPSGSTGCAASPFGDSGATWQADFFTPAAPLLAAAPWVMVRGNHELCRRGGQGWSRLLDPHPGPLDCTPRTDPYALHLGGLDLLVFDGADADDFSAPAEKVAAYAAQLAALLKTAPPHAWLLTHRPVWASAQGNMAGQSLNTTEQAAIRGLVPPGLDMVVSGHLHDFMSYEFGPERPAQLVVGVGGDTMLPLAKAPLEGAEIDGIKVRSGFALERFGFFVLERDEAGWDGTLYAADDTVLAHCRLAGRQIQCRQ
jgi:Calcineurin-like phosphoesterase